MFYFGKDRSKRSFAVTETVRIHQPMRSAKDEWYEIYNAVYIYPNDRRHHFVGAAALIFLSYIFWILCSEIVETPISVTLEIDIS